MFPLKVEYANPYNCALVIIKIIYLNTVNDKMNTDNKTINQETNENTVIK